MIFDNFGVSNGVAPAICADALHDALSGGDYDASFDMIICAVGKGVESETGALCDLSYAQSSVIVGKSVENETEALPYEVYKRHLRLPLFEPGKMERKQAGADGMSAAAKE